MARRRPASNHPDAAVFSVRRLPPRATAQTVNVSNAATAGVALTLSGSDPDGVDAELPPGQLSGARESARLQPECRDCALLPQAGYSGSDSFTFTASDGSSSSDPATVTLAVTANQAPSARFIASADGLQVQFDASGSGDLEDEPGDLQVRWDFDGDHQWDTDWSASRTAAHTYPVMGAYFARCEVQDSAGLRDSYARMLGVEPGRTDTMPAADLQVSVDGLTVALDASGSTDAEDAAAGTPLRFSWAWSARASYSAWTTTTSAQHTYSRAGAYEVSVQVRDADGNIAVAATLVTVGAADVGDYLVVDLSAGPTASSYPVSYLASLPTPISDEYKTTKLVLRRIPAGTFTMGSPPDELGRINDREQAHEVTLTEDFYIGVFEVTQQQWGRVTGTWPSDFKNTSVRGARCASGRAGIVRRYSWQQRGRRSAGERLSGCGIVPGQASSAHMSDVGPADRSAVGVCVPGGYDYGAEQRDGFDVDE